MSDSAPRAWDGDAPTPLPLWYARRRASYLEGNEVELLRGGQELFPAMRRAIDSARYEVMLATYLFHSDAQSEQLALALAQAARRGVRVRVVVDGFGSNPNTFDVCIRNCVWSMRSWPSLGASTSSMTAWIFIMDG